MVLDQKWGLLQLVLGICFMVCIIFAFHLKCSKPQSSVHDLFLSFRFIVWSCVLRIYFKVIHYIHHVNNPPIMYDSGGMSQPFVVTRKRFSAQRHVGMYILIFLVCWTPEIIHRMCELIFRSESSTCNSDALVQVHSSSRAAQGFLNFVVFAVSNKTFQNTAFKRIHGWKTTTTNKSKSSNLESSNLDDNLLVEKYDCHSPL